MSNNNTTLTTEKIIECVFDDMREYIEQDLVPRIEEEAFLFLDARAWNPECYTSDPGHPLTQMHMWELHPWNLQHILTTALVDLWHSDGETAEVIGREWSTSGESGRMALRRWWYGEYGGGVRAPECTDIVMDRTYSERTAVRLWLDAAVQEDEGWSRLEEFAQAQWDALKSKWAKDEAEGVAEEIGS